MSVRKAISESEGTYFITITQVEKKTITAGIANTTYYVRDASGNVMGVYNDAVLTEQPIYGSSRLGMYRGGAMEGKRILGEKQYELTNHLGNVLSVVTNNIRLQADSAWVNVVNANDYYAFGSTMPSRSFTSSSYRYGFNGKEKDTENAWGETEYDYGFRIYNPRYGKFLSVDPLTKSYPWYTPYQFAGNQPIVAIDQDGAEPLWSTTDFHRAEKESLDRLYGEVEGGRQFRINRRGEAIGATYAIGIWADIYFTKGKISKNLLHQFTIQFAANTAINYVTSDEVSSRIITSALNDAFNNTDLADAVIGVSNLSKLGKYQGAVKNLLSSLIDISPTGELTVVPFKGNDDVIIDFLANTANDKIEKFIPNGKYSEVVKKFRDALVGKTSEELKKINDGENKKSELDFDYSNRELPTYHEAPADKVRVQKPIAPMKNKQ